ncbi:response regulator transcription factor [Curtanaerobium respiraculi]|uniref:response regulator transcription factor n=1 Tax=Curtanaerobium respiraculi TaxID=2949669 RepID=UPI0024B39868|nr:response regulator transcription factor [Curtanaerobium respiraculi]
MRDIHEARLLVVEDDPTLRMQLLDLLGREGYRDAHGAGSVADALLVASTWRPHLYLLDVMLPDGNGFDLLRRLRETSDAPALFLSARDEDASRLRGLGMGADDYVTKPFLPAELLLRLAAVLCRSYRLPDELPVIALGETEIDLATGEVRRGDGAATTLTAKEHALVKRLSESRGSIVTTDELCRSVYDDEFGYANALAILVRRLREKVEDDPSHPRWVVTVRGLGYRLVGEKKR